ncbi:MAG: hypothetical protein AAGD28_22255, partial [Bacteroidota bacterium]
RKTIYPTSADPIGLTNTGVYEIQYPNFWNRYFQLPQEAKEHPSNMVYVDTSQILTTFLLETQEGEVEKSVVLARCYRVYLMNKWPVAERFTTYAEQAVFARQEAKDEYGNWIPIELEIDAWCGNSYKTIILGKDEYLLSRTLVYTGDFETDLRLVVTGWGTSNTFRGKINKEQLLYTEE